MLLPEIVRLYGVMVDDLYREETKAYPSYAQRLLAVYEASGRTEDFLAAEQEFARTPANEQTADDLRAWGVLHHYMMQHSAIQAQRKLEQAMAHPNVTEAVFCSAAQQKIALMCDQGKEETLQYEQKLSQDSSNFLWWLLCAAAYEFVGKNEKALEIALKGIERFPNKASLHVHAGDICRALKKYEDAFSHWKRALELDNAFLDAAYSMGFCYEELGQFCEAYKVWCELTNELDRRGLTIERKYPAEMAEHCLKRMK